MKKIFLVLLFFGFTVSLSAQHIYYGKISDHDEYTLQNQFFILGDVQNETFIYINDPFQHKHFLNAYTDKMKLTKQTHLQKIPAEHNVIGLHKIKSSPHFLVFHAWNDLSTQKQICFATKLSLVDENFYSTQTLETITYQGSDIIFKAHSSPSKNYTNIFVLGRKDQQTSAISSIMFNDAGEIVKKTINLFPMREFSGEIFDNILLNDKGDFFFYTALKDKYEHTQQTNIYFQTLQQDKLNNHSVNFYDSKKYLDDFKVFCNLSNNSWNMVGVYFEEGGSPFAKGIVLKSWENKENAKMIIDQEMSFEGYLQEIKNQIEPSVIESAEFNESNIKNKSFLALVKKMEEEVVEDEDDNGESKPIVESKYINEDEEGSVARLQYLMELFSIGNANALDVFTKTNGDFLLLLEGKSSKKIYGRGTNENSAKPSSFKPTITMGFGTSIATGSSAAASGLGMGSSVQIPIIGGQNGDENNNGIINSSSSHLQLFNLTALNFTFEGKFQWGFKLNKKQKSIVGDNLSVCTIKQQDQIYLYYVTEGAPSYIYALGISPNGKVIDFPAVRGVSVAFSIFPLLAEQTNFSSTVLPSLYKGNLVFSRIRYD